MFQFQNFGTETFFSGNETKNFGNKTFSGNETKNFGNETFFRERHGQPRRLDHGKPFSSKISELKLSRWLGFIMSNLSVPKFRNWNFLNGWVSSCQTFQFQNFGTEIFSMDGFDHVKPFSSKILELKLSRWLGFIMSNLSVPKFWNWNFLNGWVWSCQTFSSKISELKLSQCWIWSCQTFHFQNFGTETFSMVGFDHVKPFSSKILELNFFHGWIWSCQTFQFQNFGTETLSMVGLHHVKPFSSKILELKLSQWLGFITSNVSVPKFRNWIFSMVWLDHVEPFSSKISELKPWGPLKTSISGILELFSSGKNNWIEF